MTLLVVYVFLILCGLIFRAAIGGETATALYIWFLCVLAAAATLALKGG